MTWALIRFRESAFPFWNTDFHLFCLKAELLAFWTSYPDIPHPVSTSDLMSYTMTALQLKRFHNKSHYIYRVSVSPIVWGCLQRCNTGYIKRWLKLRLVLQCVLSDFGYRTATLLAIILITVSLSVSSCPKNHLFQSSHCFPLLSVAIIYHCFRKDLHPLFSRGQNTKIHSAWFPCIQSRNLSWDTDCLVHFLTAYTWV